LIAAVGSNFVHAPNNHTFKKSHLTTNHLLNYQLLWLLDTENPLDDIAAVSSLNKKLHNATISFFSFLLFHIF
jgi:hypothetical protein